MSNTVASQIDPTSLILVSKPTFLSLVWSCIAVSLCFVLFRLYVRLRVFGRIFDDDVLVILAWLILLTCAFLWHVRRTLDLLYESLYIELGAGRPPSAYYMAHFLGSLRIFFAEELLGIVGLWCVKFAFLAFFRRLGHNVKGQKVLWWTIICLTIAGLVISVGVLDYSCTFTTWKLLEASCVSVEANNKVSRSYRIVIGCDFVTDFFISTIPIRLLWNLQITLRQKIGLSAIFSLTIVTMIFCLIRAKIPLRGPREDHIFSFLCTSIELTISIITACLVSYRALFTREARIRSSKITSTTNSFAKRGQKNNSSYPYSVAVSGNRTEGHGRKSSWAMHEDDGVEILPLDVIYVRNDVAVRSYDPHAEREEEGNNSPT